MKNAAEIRKVVEGRAAGRCEYCLCPARLSPGPFAVEHIQPSSAGGGDETDNLAWSCSGCNGHKLTATTAADPRTNRRAALYHPRRDEWAAHFQWGDGGLTLVGNTPTGRATIERLKINRSNVVGLREVLIKVGQHPPGE